MSKSPRPISTGRVYYGWIVCAVCFLMVFSALGFASSPRSLFLAAITEDLGIPRSLFSISDSCRFVTTAVVNLFFGTLVARFGARKLIAGGFICLTASMLVYASSSNVITFCLAGTLLGVGLSWSTTSIAGFLVENWFSSKKGSILGVILAANGLGGAIASPLVSKLIYSEGLTVPGWRIAYAAVAALMLLVGVAAVLLIRDRPADMGLTPPAGSAAKKTARGENWDGIPFAEICRKPFFYLALVCIFLTGTVLQGMYGVASAHMKDSGLDPTLVAAVLSVCSVCLTLSKASTGFVFDRFGLRFTMLFCTGCAVVAITSLAFVSDATTAYIYGVFCAFALPLETIMLPLIARDLFGKRDYAKVMGIFVSVNTFGYATGNPLMNLYFDLTGTYRPMMLILGGVMLATAFTMQMAITAAHKIRRAA